MKQGANLIRVLVVDDDAGMVATLRDILAAAGYEVDIAYSGPEAIERIRRHPPDRILMDVRMPGIDGVEAFRAIERLSPASFVILMTAYAASHLVEEAWRERAVEVVAKPLDPEHVLSRIDVTAHGNPVRFIGRRSLTT